VKTLSRVLQADAEAVPETGPTAFEWGCIKTFRRAARIICKLPPDPGSQSQASIADLPPSQSQSESKSTLKLSELINPMWDNKLIPIADGTSKELYSNNKLNFGMDPPEDIEPTSDHLSAVKMLHDLNFFPVWISLCSVHTAVG
jgi:hypothetical protein